MRGDEDAVAVGKIILERMSSAIKSKNQSNYMTSTHRFMIFSSSFCQGLTLLCIYSFLVLPLLFLFGAMFLRLQIIPETEETNRQAAFNTLDVNTKCINVYFLIL